MKKTVIALVAVAASAGLAAGAFYLSPASADSDSENALAELSAGPEVDYVPPPIQWGACTDVLPTLVSLGAECGFLTVPLDYADKDGEKIKISVSRVKATAPKDSYQGAMVANLTSAGASGVGQSAWGQLLPENTRADYDWYGFDARGVGTSQPALSCDPNVNAYDRPSYIPANQKEIKANIKLSEDYAKACADSGSPLLEHVHTTDIAKDLDSLRKAIGRPQLNYYGYWYGAYLGQVYSTLYPNRVRRMVLDSAISEENAWWGFNFGQNEPLEQNLTAFSEWVAKYDSVYRLGGTAAEVRKKYDTTLAALKKKPAEGKYGSATWNEIFLLSYNTGNWNTLAMAFSTYVNDQDTTRLKEIFDANYPTTSDNLLAMQSAISCSDAPWPADWDTWLEESEKSQKTAPFATWVNTWYFAPCQSWPVKADQAFDVDGSKAPPTLMLIDTTIDANTEYSSALEVRKDFPKAVLVESSGSVPADGTSTTCVGGALVNYLKVGTLPDRVEGDQTDVVCPANDLPAPGGGTAGTGAVPGFAPNVN
ncbi:alpha/beta hydrolase [Kineosporia rhizophila]|uniref:alpha/beta fold hydrolase n=1 Tax=Kineosporia rhizophila TaxID=84633 RepID=UPI001E60E116|nr:alpha/beta fold hydrolase [Kineosporia rhizophila]MCE0537492.1 alpha/beta hydrolase [Kineosporia rhizophila]